MLAAIKYNFAHLFDFGRRDARSTFWYWVLFVVVLNIVVSLAVSIPMTAAAMSTAAEVAQSGDATAAQAAAIERMADMAKPLIWVSIVVGLANIVLLAASFVRRLHDSGKPAVWALIAGAAQVVTVFLALAQIGDAEAMIRGAAAARSAGEAFAAQPGMAWQSLLGWMPLIILIVFGVMKSDEGANRYGEGPVRF
jgi:uncharacterized membrane protein YhaH (DUF805 family)